MKKYPFSLAAILLFVIMFPFAAGCISATGISSTDIPSTPLIQSTMEATGVEVTIRPTISNLMQSGMTPTVTAKSTLTPSNFSTVIPTASKILLLTLDPTKQQNAVVNLMHRDASCALPCFWGFLPGKTKWSEMKIAISEKGFDWGEAHNSSIGGGQTYQTNIGSAWSPFTLAVSSLVVKDDLDGLLIGIGGSGISTSIPDYDMPNLIKTIGTPSRVWMSSSWNTTPLPNFEFWIFYDERGIVLRYTSFALLIDNKFKICPKDPNRFVSNPSARIFGENIYLQNPNNPRKLEDLVQVWGEKIPDLPNYREGISGHSIEDAAGLTPIDFYHGFTDNSFPECFITSKALWIKR